MNELEWLTTDSPQKVMSKLQYNGISERKMRLAICAIARMSWDRINAQECRRAVEVAERYADNYSFTEELIFAHHAALRALRRENTPIHRLAFSCTCAEFSMAQGLDKWFTASRLLAPRQADVLRDIFSNPWRPVRLGRPVQEGDWTCFDIGAMLAWKDGTVPKMAGAIYDHGRWGQMPILADALEEAGCQDEAILQHCRNSSPHVRGCFVIDMLTGGQR